MTSTSTQGRQEGRSPDHAQTRILIVDDHQLVSDALTILLEREADLEVCGRAANAAQAKPLVTKLLPDIVLLDLMLDGVIALRLLSWLHRLHPEVVPLVTSMYDESLYGERVLTAGARGFISKTASSKTLLQAIRTVRTGSYFFSDALVRQLLEQTGNKRRRKPDRLPELLTEREMEVFCLLGEGKKTAEIAHLLNLSASTIETYRERLKRKLGISNAAQLTYAAVCWLRDGLLPELSSVELSKN